ncbi:LytR C-terminal domain-containing protein [Pseudoduganella sp. GCM10020061]|uniref:LytR C-terminal domain-containing protein n=1 Tax=Pseudoduganella sp. GCM10020061 TaxID=3317345 RepID=UPI0036277797
MSTTMKRISAACASALLLACANTPDDRPARIPELADDSPSARNLIATQLAEKADYAGAIRIWRTLTATQTGPEAAYLYRNLGYALFLNGEYEASLASLEKACLLDPLNPRGWMHLGSALRKLGKHARAEMMFRQAATLERHEFTVDYALARGSRVPAIVSAVEAPARPKDDWAARVLDASGGVIDLRTITAQPQLVEGEPQAVVAPLPAEPVRIAQAPDGYAEEAPPQVVTAPVDLPSTVESAVESAQALVRLEVRNGNGVRGMAAATARKLASDKLRVVRLTNEKGFNVDRTRIEYVSGFQDAASKLAQRFGAATMVQVDQCWKADMRLVIGKDQVSTRPAVVASAAAAKLQGAAKGRESAAAGKAVRPAAPGARG